MKIYPFIIIAIVVAIAGCTGTTGYVTNNGGNEMTDKQSDAQSASAHSGDKIAVDYWGTLDDGTQFDTSEGREPLEFTAGAGQMIKGFDAAVIGMKVGEEKNVRIEAKDAYGEYDSKAVIEIPMEQLKAAGIAPKKGDTLSMRGQPVKVLEVNETTVTIDTNHPLAGKALNFKIKLIKIIK